MCKIPGALTITALAVAGCVSMPVTTAEDVGVLGETLAKSICGKQPPSRIETIPNPHVDGVIDKIEYRTCRNGSSTLYLSNQASDPSGLAMNLVILQPGSGVPDFLEISSPLSKVSERMGKPAVTDKNSITYVFGDYEDKFTVQSHNGTIRSLSWSWSVD